MIIIGVVYIYVKKNHVKTAESQRMKMSLSSYAPKEIKETIPPAPKKIESKPRVEKITSKPAPKVSQERIEKEINEEVIEVEKVVDTKENEKEEIIAMENTQESTSIDEPTLSQTDFEILRDLVFANLKYPTIAKRMQITGTVELILVIDSNGKLLDVLLQKSSGNKHLDKSALAAAKHLSDNVLPHPHVLTRVIIPVTFTLH